MFAYDGFHVVCTAVTYFCVIFVEDFVEFVVLVKVLVDELEEGFADVGLYVLTVGWVIPYDVSLSVSAREGDPLFVKDKGSWYPLDCRASSYIGLALLNSVSLRDMSDILRLMAAGSCLMMLGGWLDLVLM